MVIQKSLIFFCCSEDENHGAVRCPFCFWLFRLFCRFFWVKIIIKIILKIYAVIFFSEEFRQIKIEKLLFIKIAQYPFAFIQELLLLLSLSIA